MRMPTGNLQGRLTQGCKHVERKEHHNVAVEGRLGGQPVPPLCVGKDQDQGIDQQKQQCVRLQQMVPSIAKN